MFLYMVLPKPDSRDQTTGAVIPEINGIKLINIVIEKLLLLRFFSYIKQVSVSVIHYFRIQWNDGVSSVISFTLSLMLPYRWKQCRNNV